MSVHLHRQMRQLNSMVQAMGESVGQVVHQAIQAVQQRDPKLAQQIIENDANIDAQEVELEEECLHTLALYQPVANDLRLVISTLKINNDLERIGDLAVNIAELARALAQLAPEELPFDLHGMAEQVRSMVDDSIQSLIHVDAATAERVRRRDDEVDRMHRTTYSRIESVIRQDPELVQSYIYLLSVSRNLERIADHAVNIAEDVIYLERGEILRHERPSTDWSDPGPASSPSDPSAM
jgi:phosphate transport system protein